MCLTAILETYFFQKKFFRLTLLLSSYLNINPGPANVSNTSIPLNTLPFDNCDELNMPSEHSSSDSCKAHNDSKWIIFEKRAYIFYIRMSTVYVLPAIDDIIYIEKQSNASIIEISESKLNLSIRSDSFRLVDLSTRLFNQLNIENCNLISMDRSRRGGGDAYYIRKSLLTVMSQTFAVTLKAFL